MGKYTSLCESEVASGKGDNYDFGKDEGPGKKQFGNTGHV